MSDTYVPNSITVSLNEDATPSVVINGVEVAGAIMPDWTLTSMGGEHGERTALLTVTFPVIIK
jgi:hypothetical protein